MHRAWTDIFGTSLAMEKGHESRYVESEEPV